MTSQQAIRNFLDANTGQKGKRLTVLLAATGLTGDEPVTKAEGGEEARDIGSTHGPDRRAALEGA